jgi:hypothetical protein
MYHQHIKESTYTNIKKSNGPNMLPCGTPTVTGLALNVELLIDVTTVRDGK